MPATPADIGLKAEYAAKVAADLERNSEEQQRIQAQIAGLEEQLAHLRRDHDLLVTVQQALGDVSAAVAGPSGADGSRQMPKPRTASRPSKKAASGPVGGGNAGTGTKALRKSTQPTLVTLVRSHLAQDTGPQSAAEITAALNRAHPDRAFKATVVRNALEALVSRAEARRSKQGRDVYYSASEDGSGIGSGPDTAAAEPATA